jgi:ubiquinone/menaquinone biosynthesis C-methylase UbiE
MKREWTNRIRFVLDELLPPIIRDSGWFMWPFYVAAYRTFSVRHLMTFKSKAYSMTDDEYASFYGSLGNSVSRLRPTDLNSASLNAITDQIPRCAGLSILDVGTGNGYLLEQLEKIVPWARLAGIDVAPPGNTQSRFEIYAGALPKLPFRDKEFDVVTCTHVLEHVLDPLASAKELVRVASKQIFVVVPKQRYFYYTLDEHLNFYPNIEPLMNYFRPFKVTASLQRGDWVVSIVLDKSGGC